MKAFFRSQAQRLTLRQSLGRTHMVTSLTAVCMAGLLLTGIALLALRIYADHNLELVARAISYTSEAAVVFHDEEAAAGHCHPRGCGTGQYSAAQWQAAGKLEPSHDHPLVGS